MQVRLAMQFFDGLSNFECRRCRRHGLPEADRHRLQKTFWKFPEVLSIVVAEDTSPDASQVNWNYRRIHSFHDEFHSTPEWQQLSDASHLAFRENAHHFTRCDSLTGGSQGSNHFPRAQFGRNGDAASQDREGVNQWMIVEVLENEEANRAV
jgi:hypothetical protein